MLVYNFNHTISGIKDTEANTRDYYFNFKP